MFAKIWKWIKSFFGFESEEKTLPDQSSILSEESKIEHKVEPEVEQKIEKDPVLDKKTKIALIVGHNSKRQGAVNYKQESEFSFNSRIAKKVKEIMNEKYPNKTVKIFKRPEGYYSASIRQVGKNVGKWRAKISLELHFNASKTEAYGCEILVIEQSDNLEEKIKIADKITDDLAKEFGLKERHTYKYKDGLSYGDGVKILKPRDRGALNLKYAEEYGVKHSMLIEPCFANIETEESRAIFENEDKYAEFLADQLAKIDA